MISTASMAYVETSYITTISFKSQSYYIVCELSYNISIDIIIVERSLHTAIND